MSDQPTLHLSRDGTQEWLLNGNRHREGGPAIEGADGSKYWYLNGKTHREDGPAMEHANGTKEWLLNGDAVTDSELDIMKMRIWMENGKNYF